MTLRNRLLSDSDYFRYERSFEDEANRSSTSYISSQSLLRQLEQSPNNRELKKKRKQIRLQKMKEEECIICMVAMSTNIPHNSDPFQVHEDIERNAEQINTFMLTPCKHKFHKQCLLKWVEQRHQCPTCRKVLPLY